MNVTTNSEQIESPEQFLEKLRKALKKDGDFPASARVVTELRKLASDPKTPGDKITELILREPSLGTRILSVVNSAYFRRVKPIMTISQAVMQLGMQALAELCAGLVLLQKFVPNARQNTPFAACLRKTILTSLLSSTLNPQINPPAAGKQEETGYLAGAFLELGPLLLAFYFPQIYDAATKRAEQKRVPVGVAIHQIIGLTPAQLSIEVVKALELPGFYIDLLQEVSSPTTLKSGETLPILKDQIVRLGKSVSAAEKVVQVIAEGGSKVAVDHVIQEVQASLGISLEALNTSVGALPPLFNDHCGTLQLSLPSLPDFVAQYSPASANTDNGDGTLDKYSAFLQEIRSAVESGEPTASVITSVMEALAFGLGFDRVMLLLLNGTRQKLHGRMMLGTVPGFDPAKFEASVSGAGEISYLRAIAEKKLILEGGGVFDNGWPLAALPIGTSQQVVGVVYADRKESADTADLTDEEKKVLQVIVDLIEKSMASASLKR